MRLTPTQQALMSLLARYRRNGAPYPSAKEIAVSLCLEASDVPMVLRSLERLGAIHVDRDVPNQEFHFYDSRLTLIWDDERIALGGAEQLPLWREA